MVPKAVGSSPIARPKFLFMTFLIIHGIGGHAGIHWQQWLKQQLELQGHKVLMPDMPNSDHPDRQEWLDTVIAVTKKQSINELVLVGHSLGVTTVLDFIEWSNAPVAGLVSVSGFASDYCADLNSYFLQEKTIDFDKVLRDISKAVVIYSDNDPYVTQDALKEVADKLKVSPIIVNSGGHLNSDAGLNEFPLLLKLLINF